MFKCSPDKLKNVEHVEVISNVKTLVQKANRGTQNISKTSCCHVHTTAFVFLKVCQRAYA